MSMPTSRSSSSIAHEVTCPVCNKEFTSSEIEDHVNRCLFLNSKDSLCSPKSLINKRRSSLYTDNSEAGDNTTNSTASKKIKTDSDLSCEVTTVRVPKLNETQQESTIASVSLEGHVPLAEQIRPSTLEGFVGQEKILGSSSMLRNLLDKGDVTSMILWGPPGCGKTTLANVISCKCRQGKISARFVKMSAVNSGVANVKEVVKVAKNELVSFKRRTILFMDEIHRFNKLQQDIFLPHVESGCIILIGATTENPSFSLNSALLSRCRVFVLEKLSAEEISSILISALKKLGAKIIESEECRGSTRNELLIEREALNWLAYVCDGDARIALNSLQLAFQARNQTSVTANEIPAVTLEDIKESVKRSHMLYDRAGDEHYNLISALHKSIRASDQNAALYWLTRMLQGGEDPRFVARRLVRAASEDIGLADSSALSLAVSTMQGCQLLGMPESDVLLAQCAVYLARAPKSREINNALSRAKENISQHQGPLPSVPLHLRNAPTRLMEQLGYGQGYSMKPDEVPDMIYMPEGLETLDFFGP